MSCGICNFASVNSSNGNQPASEAGAVRRIACRLNLPAAHVELRQGAGGPEVFDPCRSRWVALTPEEWVRQHFVGYLVDVLGVPRAMVANERGISLNGTSRRCDTVVYSRSLRPVAIVEYKAPSVAVTRAVFDQIVRYNVALHVGWLIVSNGMHHYCCRVDYGRGECVFVKDLPTYADMVVYRP